MLQILKRLRFPVQRLQSQAKNVESIRDEATWHVPLNPDSDDSDNSPLEDVLEKLKSDVDALIELGPCLEEPIQDTLVAEAPAPPPQVTADNRGYQTFFKGIKQKLPQCDDNLARALSKAFYDNMERLIWERLNSERQTASYEPVGELPKDSGYGTSVKDSISYATTLASIVDVDDKTPRTPFPSQPKGLKIGENFPCVACGQQVAKSESGGAYRYAYTYFLVRPLLGAVANDFTDDICFWICDRGSVAKCSVGVTVHSIRGMSGITIFKPNMRFILSGTIRSVRSASASSPRGDAR
jgi:hypothetical protein